MPTAMTQRALSSEKSMPSLMRPRTTQSRSAPAGDRAAALYWRITSSASPPSLGSTKMLPFAVLSRAQTPPSVSSRQCCTAQSRRFFDPKKQRTPCGTASQIAATEAPMSREYFFAATLLGLSPALLRVPSIEPKKRAHNCFEASTTCGATTAFSRYFRKDGPSSVSRLSKGASVPDARKTLRDVATSGSKTGSATSSCSDKCAPSSVTLAWSTSSYTPSGPRRASAPPSCARGLFGSAPWPQQRQRHAPRSGSSVRRQTLRSLCVSECSPRVQLADVAMSKT
mmetsp:Transcript_10200/g.33427  ORF Transcript_10200/g.33427 Transcript_10200/m.33427 type:complete len:283 (-) Transcript_10200:291-1139(-)